MKLENEQDEQSRPAVLGSEVLKAGQWRARPTEWPLTDASPALPERVPH